ncbi:MAG: winged helix-turn-helix domain-containing protein [Pyrinomonadaceae bacterium]
MSLETKSFEFGEFLLDTKERVLLRNGVPLSVTPKAYLLLLTLIKDHGRIIHKDELMDKVWEDSFVEEGNLAFTVGLIRRALGDDSHHPRFIATVPRRGYRFVADVIERNQRNGSDRVELPLQNKPKKRRASTFNLIVSGVFLIVVSLAVWDAIRPVGDSIPVLKMPLGIEPLSTNGEAFHSTMSPDGRNVVYISGRKHSVRLRQLDTGNDVEIVAFSGDVYGGIAFSPDGNSIYVARSLHERPFDIYRLSIFGGIPTKLVDGAQGWISVSPSGQLISFVRCPRTAAEWCSLWVADAVDGKNERKLVSRLRPIRISDSNFSPDGTSVAFASGQSENASSEFGISSVEIESGTVRELSVERFFNVRKLSWLPGGGILLSASKLPDDMDRIWYLEAISGTVKAISRDSESFATVSTDTGAKLMVATRISSDFQIRVYNTGKLGIAPRAIASATSAAYAPDGRILFSSSMTGNSEIWSASADGTSKRQLTNNKADERSPVPSPDGVFVYFCSNKTGEAHVWRMRSDGSEQIQITDKIGGIPLFVSPDNRWLYYHSGPGRTLMRIQSLGGNEEEVFGERIERFALSADGRHLAFPDTRGGRPALGTFSLENGAFTTFDLGSNVKVIDVGWDIEGNGLVYIAEDLMTGQKSIRFFSMGDKESRIIREIGDDEVLSFVGGRTEKGSIAVIQGAWKHDAVLIRGLKVEQ